MTTSSEYPVDDFQRNPTGTKYSLRDRVEASQNELEQNNDLVLDIKNRKFGQQYASVYYMRLELLRQGITKIASEAWEGMKINDITATQCKKILDVRQGQLVWLVGTVYKEMKNKPNILEEVSQKVYGPPPEQHERYISDDDDCLLEDESGRLELYGEKVASTMLVTGSVIAVLGTEDSAGNFQVIDIKLPGYAPQLPKPVVEQNKFVAIASGLNIGSPDENPIKLNLLQEFLSGELGGDEDSDIASSITMLIIAGDSIAPQKAELQPGKTRYGRDNTIYNGEPMKRFDRFVADLSTTMKVSIMPGPGDPATATMPQQPLHTGLFPDSRLLNPDLVTNPYMYDVDGIQMLGASGQTIDDIYKYVETNDRLDMMDHTLQWQHMAPTCPDTLWSYPFADNDPFVLQNTPHVYFVGNQPSFSTREVGNEDTKTTLITVPRFQTSGELVLLNLQTLQAHTLHIN